MALNIKTGTLTQPGAAGNQTIPLPPDFDPKFIIFQCVGRAANGGGSANATWTLGMATFRAGAIQQRYIEFNSRDAIGTASVQPGSGQTAVCVLTNGISGTRDFELRAVSMQTGSSSEFVVNWFNLHTTASVRVHYWVIGGTSVLDAMVGQFTNALGVQDITVAAGFDQPSVIFFPLSWNGTDAATLPSAHGTTGFGWGVKSSSANGRAIRFGSSNAAGTQATHQAIYNNRSQNMGDAETQEWVGQVNPDSGWPVDGFEHNYLTNTVPGFPTLFGAIRFSSDVIVTTGELVAPTSGTLPVVQSIATGGTPKGLLAMTVRHTTANAIDASSTNAAMWAIGTVDSDGQEGVVGAYDDDAQGTASVTGTFHTDAKLLQYYVPSSDTLDAEADAIINGQNYDVSWNDLPPAAFIIEYIAFAEVAAAADKPPRARRVMRRRSPARRGAAYAR